MYANDTEFWESSSRLRHIRDTARCERAAPWAVLPAVLARVSVAIPPNVVVPAFVGGEYGSLNMFVAIVGGSSDGKGVAVGCARRLVPDILDAVTTLPVSGEGLPTMFARREPVDGGAGDAKHTVLKCVNCRALLDVPEVSVLGAAMGRTGSTLLGTLTSVWSGEALGGQNVGETKRLRVPSYGYRVALTTGVQPGNSDMLTREDVTGLPQRILWGTTRDPDAPETRPDGPAGAFGFDTKALAGIQPDAMTLNGLYQNGNYWTYRNENDTLAYPLEILKYPPEVRDEVDRDAYARLHGTRPAGMDGHSLFLSIKVAGVLAVMEQRSGHEYEVTVDDWERAKYITARSRQFREECINTGRRERRGKRRDALADELVAKDEAQELAAREKAERDHRRYAQRITKQLRDRDGRHEGITGTELKRFTGLLADNIYPALQRMFDEGQLEKTGPDTGRPQSQLWALPSA
ncbi:DUF3987 domain-containing protein [Bifidobacterium miconisargentati]|uniref:DUF3987 domain-containing protein n=1 Tax=Bifidobacterium miconisargentati TaxID=2834437 RepID=UPI001BDBB7CF|nr:DUF3987 domain-containing protein [Bifidobacterium miconisargentati]MBW3089589.1 hypothetical protein [Bifidobacterium miconisargentati]